MPAKNITIASYGEQPDGTPKFQAFKDGAKTLAVFGFDEVGGFYVIDHESRQASYAYPTSPFAVAAKKNPAKVAGDMTSKMLDDNRYAAPEIIENHYLAVCRSAPKKEDIP